MNSEEVAREATELRKKYLALERDRTKMHVQVPRTMRFPLIWTLFFAIIGIILQSLRAKSFVFADFFVKNYMDWFSSLGGFTEAYQTSSEALWSLLLSHWHYFFFTGGLISLLWAIIYTILHSELILRKHPLPA